MKHRHLAHAGSPESLKTRVEELHRQLAGGVEGLQSADRWRQMLEFASRFHRYSIRNMILISLAHDAAYRAGLVASPRPTYVAGFHTWNTLGRRIDKGQKGYPILAPAPYEVRLAVTGGGRDSAARPLGRREQPRAGERLEIEKRLGWQIEHVFDVSQTSGKPLPTPPRPQPLTGEAPEGLIESLTRLATERGFSVDYAADAATLRGADGMTRFDTATILVRKDMPDAAIACTLSHEIGHVLLHDPNGEPTDAATHRGIGEVEAESVAYIVAAAHGMDTSADSLPYVATWANSRTPADVVQETARRVSSAAHRVLTGLDTLQLGDGSPPGAATAVAVRLGRTGVASAVDRGGPHLGFSA